ncbi:TaqI-like C-terminal specificity domain-containing protein [Yeosuana sp. AK3]
MNENDEVAQGIVPNADKVNSRNINCFTQDEIIKNRLLIGEGVFVLNKGQIKNLNKTELNFIKPVYEPYLTDRYSLLEYDKEIIYSTVENSISISETPNLYKHLERFRPIMEKRRENLKGARTFHQLHWPRDKFFFEKGAKILSVRKCSKPTFIYTENDAYVMMSFNIIKSKRIDLKYLTGILNSKLVEFWLLHKGKMQGNNFQVDKEPLLNIPIFKSTNKEDTETLISLVDKIIDTKHQKKSASTSSDEDFYERKILNLENQINNFVYKLYDLSIEDIAVIESI